MCNSPCFVFGPGNLAGFDRPQDRGSVQAGCRCGCCEGVGHGVAYPCDGCCVPRCAATARSVYGDRDFPRSGPVPPVVMICRLSYFVTESSTTSTTFGHS